MGIVYKNCIGINNNATKTYKVKLDLDFTNELAWYCRELDYEILMGYLGHNYSDLIYI